MEQFLANVVWHALSGAHLKYSTGTDRARRYAPGFSPIVGFPEPQRPDFEALRPFCEGGEHFYCDGWSGPAPGGWRVEHETTMFKMLWDAELPQADAAPEATQLGPEHAAQALELATLTQPGPFGIRTLELGEYFGIFEGGRLVAMAGERMAAGPLREISGVCTHPEYQGRGWAQRLVLKLLRREMRRGETPFLHVMSANENARRLYRRLGFTEVRESVVRVVAPL